VRNRRRWIVLLVVVALVLGGAWVQDKPNHIYYAHVVDDHTLSLGVTGPEPWTRVVAVTEGADTIVVSVKFFTLPLPGYSDDATELTVHLRDALGGRSVIDASNGQAVKLTACGRPAEFRPGCEYPAAPPGGG
jgi:hypothetical protein